MFERDLVYKLSGYRTRLDWQEEPDFKWIICGFKSVLRPKSIIEPTKLKSELRIATKYLKFKRLEKTNECTVMKKDYTSLDNVT